MESGEIFFAENCIPVAKIDFEGILGSVARVCIENHAQFDQVEGWTPYEFATKKIGELS